MFLKKYLWSILVVSLLLLIVPISAANLDSKVTVTYHPHIEDIGWTDEISNGEVAGTTGQDKAIQAIEIKADLPSDSSIEYQSHLSSIGWEENWASNGIMSGTTGENRPIEAIKIRLTGSAAQLYDVYYRTHISSVGWLDWACNGQDAGSSGLCRKLQAIQVVILDKGSPAPGSTERYFVCKGMTPINKAETHISNVGWVEGPYIDNMIGTTGQSNAIEALQLTYSDEGNSGIEYRMHLADLGWEDTWHADGEMSGTTGQNRPAEAIQIRLTGYAADNYDIYYQAHCSNFGWLNWAKNGESAGSVKCAKKLEAINIAVVPKGSDPPGLTLEPLREPISEETFRSRVKGAWCDLNKAEEPVNSYMAGISEFYMFTGFNQSYNGIEGYFEVLTANVTGGWIRIVDQKTGSVNELYLSFRDIPANHLIIVQDGITRELALGDTTDGIHYSFPGVKQYGQLAVVELKTKPSN